MRLPFCCGDSQLTLCVACSDAPVCIRSANCITVYTSSIADATRLVPLKPRSNTEHLVVPDANLIILSSDIVYLRVHKPVLAMASPIFKDLLSLPQHSNNDIVDGLPVVRLPESSELLNCLLSSLYPVRIVKSKSYEKVSFCLRLNSGNS
jgi:BTB/POZ domain